jgi:hypothetical protein
MDKVAKIWLLGNSFSERLECHFSLCQEYGTPQNMQLCGKDTGKVRRVYFLFTKSDEKLEY